MRKSRINRLHTRDTIRGSAMAQRLIGVTFRKRWVCYVGAILCTFLLPFQVAAIGGVPAGHVASHGLERDIVNADGTGEGARSAQC